LPLIVDEKRYVYPHNAKLEANWISLDDAGKWIVAAMDRPHVEGSWLNIGGPQRVKPPEVAAILSRVFGHEIKYDPCTPKELGNYRVKAFGDNVPPGKRESMAAVITVFYEVNNKNEARPFEVDTDFMQQRLPQADLDQGAGEGGCRITAPVARAADAVGLRSGGNHGFQMVKRMDLMVKVARQFSQALCSLSMPQSAQCHCRGLMWVR
jgi:hypothetical protein